VYNNPCQIWNVSFLNIITHPFKRKLCSGSQAVLSHMRRKFSVMIEATYDPHPQFHRHWQIFVQTKLLLLVETCDNLMQLDPNHMGGLGEVQISAARLLQGRYRGKRTRVITLQKNPLVPCSVHHTAQTFSCNVLTDYKKNGSQLAVL
jgi:hypothetical protein